MSDLKERQEIKDRLTTDKAMSLACNEDGLNIDQRKLIVELCNIIELSKANEAKKETEKALHKHIVTNSAWLNIFPIGILAGIFIGLLIAMV